MRVWIWAWLTYPEMGWFEVLARLQDDQSSCHILKYEKLFLSYNGLKNAR